MLIYPSSEKFKLLEIILLSLHSNSYTNIVQYEIHVNHLHIYHSDDIKKEKTMNLNSKIEEKRGGAVTDICVHFSFSPTKIEKISSKFRIDHNFIAMSFAHMLLENQKLQ